MTIKVYRCGVRGGSDAVTKKFTANCQTFFKSQIKIAFAGGSGGGCGDLKRRPWPNKDKKPNLKNYFTEIMEASLS
jgi:hypothetical protein